MREAKPPEANESEKAILAAILFDPSCARQVADLVTPEDFFDGRHQKIMAGVYCHLADDVAVTLDAIMAKLSDENGSAAYLAKLMDWPAAIDIRYHCEQIRQAARRREVLVAANRIVQACNGCDWSAFDASTADAERRLKAYREGVAREKGERGGFKLVPIGEFKNHAHDWLVQRLIERNSLGNAFADPGAAKSLLFGVDLGCCVASGIDFHGHKVECAGPVIYIAGEGHSGLGRRFAAWGIRHQLDSKKLPIFASVMPAALCDDDQLAIVAQAVKEIAEKHGPPALIVVDTVARNFGPGDENSTADMTRFIAGCDRLRGLYGSAVLLIHHSGHGAKDRARGSMALKGALDFEYRLEKDAEGIIRMEVAKPPKDFEPHEPMAFVIRSVELGFTDQDGNQVTGPILDQVDYEPRDKEPAGNTGRGKWQAVALNILDRLQLEHRQRLASANLNPDGARVKVADWTEACKAAGMTRGALWKVKTALVDQRLILITDGFVASPSPSPSPSPPY